MSAPSLPPDVDAALARLSKSVDGIWGKILDEQTTLMNRWYYEKPPVRIARLQAMERNVGSLAGAAAQRIQAEGTTLRAAYEIGAWNTALKAGTTAVFTLADIDAMTRIAFDTMDDLLAATQYVRASTKGLVREMTRDYVNVKVITGKTARDAGLDLAVALADRGITSMVYANGARVGLTTYTDMVMRTKSAVAYQVGGFEQGKALDITWWEMMDGPDCVMPGQRFTSQGELLQIVRASFHGMAYTISTTVGGPSVTVGPNHPVMTDRGWVLASELHEGDQVVDNQWGQFPLPSTKTDFEQAPMIEDVFESAAQRFGVALRQCRRDDLHGDGRFCEGEIQVVTLDRSLLVEDDAAVLQERNEPDFMFADSDLTFPTGTSGCRKLGVGSHHSAHSIMSSLQAGFALLRSRLTIPNSQRLGGATRKTRSTDERVDLRRSEAQPLGDTLRRFATFVGLNNVGTRQSSMTQVRTLDGTEPSTRVVLGREFLGTHLTDAHPHVAPLIQFAHSLRPVIRIEKVPYNGWVYDATTTVGTFSINNILVKNCGLSYHDDPILADGLIVKIDRAQSYPISHPNCIMPGQRVAFYGGLKQIQRAWFSGPAYRLTLADGNTATVGPNHPMLTGRGWLSGHLIREGDQLVNDTSIPLPRTVDAATESDLEQMPFVEDLFEAVQSVGLYATVAATGDDLHGDGRFCEGEIQVVDVEPSLLPKVNVPLPEHVRERLLMGSSVQDSILSGDGTLDPLLVCSRHAPHCVVRGVGSPGAFVGTDPLLMDAKRLALGSGEPHLRESGPDGCPIDSDASTGLSGGQLLVDVQLDESLIGDGSCGHRFSLVGVVSVEEFLYEGWVYDASTGDGAFTCNSLVVRNCVRVTSPRPDIETAKEASRATRTSSQEQVADQAAASRARQAANARQPQRVALDRQLATRQADPYAVRSGGLSAAQERYASRLAKRVPVPPTTSALP